MAIVFNPFFRYCDANNAPLDGGRLVFLDPDTQNAKNVYSDESGNVSLGANITLDNEGMVDNANGVWLGSGDYTCRVQEYAGLDGNGDPTYTTLYEIEYIAGVPASSGGGDTQATVANMAALRAIPSASAYSYVYLMGYYTAGDGGGGWFKWVVNDTASDDSGIIIALDDSPALGRYYRSVPSIIDPAFWGAVPDYAGDVTGAINSCIDYANSVRGTVYFREGVYTVSGTDVNIYCHVKIPYASWFKNTSGIASYVLAFGANSSYDLPAYPLWSADTVGFVYPDFTEYRGIDEGVYLNLYPELYLASVKAGKLSLVCTSTYTAEEVVYATTIESLVVRGYGCISFGGGAETVTIKRCKVESRNMTTSIFTGVLPASFVFSGDVYASWFGTDGDGARQAFSEWSIGGIGYIDQAISVDDETYSNSWACRVQAIGDNVVTVDGRALTIDDYVDGTAWIKCQNDGYVVCASGVPRVNNFVLVGAGAYVGFIRSCGTGWADFEGKTVAVDFNLASFGSIRIRNMVFSKSFVIDTSETLTLEDCTLTGPAGALVCDGTYNLVLRHCNLVNTGNSVAMFSVTSLKMIDCDYAGAAYQDLADTLEMHGCRTTTSRFTVKDCSIDSSYFSGVYIYLVQNDSLFINGTIKGCKFDSCLIGLVAGTYIGLVDISGNDFYSAANPHDPIVLSACTASNITGSFRIADNTPKCTSIDDSLPAVVVRTTEPEFSATIAATWSGTTYKHYDHTINSANWQRLRATLPSVNPLVYLGATITQVDDSIRGVSAVMTNSPNISLKLTATSGTLSSETVFIHGKLY